ncbi:MAG TPA: ATP-binding cassette domain-containing protein [Polyangiaceae bacterium]|jgi:ABC-2 type transport system ATP-binding protein|nr:ATP-binding cassette domain-containing protein [Polyangiaceae bacterium]
MPSSERADGPIIMARALCKSYRVAAKEPGVAGALRHFFRREYKDVEAVKGVSFEIERGEFVGFLGANGAGKTTTLKMLTGLLLPSSGELRVSGHFPFDRRSDFLKRITLVMGQKQQLMWDLPALDSLRVNAAVYDLPKLQAERRIAELAEMLEIESKLTLPVRKLSLGERMKCELLAALLHEPEVLMLDEPTLGLDVNAQDSIRRFLKDYNQTRRATVLLTSHYMADIVALCPRVLLIHEGRLVYDGSLEALTERVAPYRQLRLELPELVSRERLATYAEVELLEGRKVVLSVDRAQVTNVVARVLAELKPLDLGVTDPPIEQVIGRVFAGQKEALA